MNQNVAKLGHRAWSGATRSQVRAPIGRQAGLVAAVLTDETYRVQVQMGARLVWDQEATNLRSVPGFDPEVPDLRTVVEGWLPILG